MKNLSRIIFFLLAISVLCLVFKPNSIKSNNIVLLKACTSDTDYRDTFTGYYYALIHYYWWYCDGSSIHEDFDTTVVVDKFYGYTAGDDSNYIDIEHKLGITFDSYSTDHDDSWCGNTNYYTHGFLHPTVDSAGVLTYPELESCQGGSISGGFIADSMNILYGNYNQWGGFEWRIIGHKDSTLTSNHSFPLDSFFEISISPNPAKDYIKITGLDYPLNITITDLMGKVYLKEVNVGNLILLGMMSEGCYVVILESRHKRFVNKLVIL